LPAVTAGRRVRAQAWASTTLQAIQSACLTFETITKQGARVPRRLGVRTRSSDRRGCDQASWRLPVGNYSKGHFPVHYPVLAPERTPDFLFPAQRRNLSLSVQTDHPAPGKTIPARVWNCSRDLAAVEVADKQVGAHPRQLFTGHVSGALSGACTGKGPPKLISRPTPKPEHFRPP
jgi:hypothetical protein